MLKFAPKHELLGLGRFFCLRTCPLRPPLSGVGKVSPFGDDTDRLVPMSAFGTKRTWVSAPHMSAFGGTADMTFCAEYICF